MSFRGLHKFYVSVTQVDYNQTKGRIEISSRIFIDDLEKVLDKKYNQKLNLATRQESSKAKELIAQYVTEKMSVLVNHKEKKLIFLGSEYEDDVLICYLKVDYSEKITTFDLYNSLLTEFFSEQQNIVHTNINKVKKSFLLTLSDKTAHIEY
ncbi:hypothetical protein DI487_09505 [Flavobacterium sediminis]|uniref:Peptidase E n=1 Tax=Flavobacterium sediminis TaxID=2201181 RepID=A0A2U8QV45_9FLAO|nr:hypothetical protein DI487_09505 [Flavobacterium sediminis]